MIEKIILEYLKAEMDVPVFVDQYATETPRIVIEKTGSSRTNQLDAATFAVQSYADSLYGAAMLNEEVKQVMTDAVNLESIASVNLNSDYNFTDTTTKSYRYQAVFEITYYRS